MLTPVFVIAVRSRCLRHLLVVFTHVFVIIAICHLYNIQCFTIILYRLIFNIVCESSILSLFYYKLLVIVIVIVTTGASCVGELLKVNNSLQELDMGYSPIGDNGMSSVADGLQCNNTLTNLGVYKCGFSVKGTVVYKTE